jgi:hypothetical protein
MRSPLTVAHGFTVLTLRQFENAPSAAALTRAIAFGKVNLANDVPSLRRRLIVLVSCLLACQVATMVAAPVLLHQPSTAATDGSGILCGCKEEPGAECPMHKGKHQSAGSESGTLRACAGYGDRAAVLTFLTGTGGILQPASHDIRPATRSVALAALITPVLNADRSPTSPPPRS